MGREHSASMLVRVLAKGWVHLIFQNEEDAKKVAGIVFKIDSSLVVFKTQSPLLMQGVSRWKSILFG